MVNNTMRPKTFEHIGAARIYAGTLRIDIKSMQAVISKPDLSDLMQNHPVSIYDISDIIKSVGEPDPVGRAWITQSRRAVMYRINGMQYTTSLEQLRAVLQGIRKYAGVAMMTETPAPRATVASCMAAGVTA